MQLKRILAIFLAAALIFSIPTIGVGAESTEIFEVGVVAETTAPVSASPVIFNSGDEVSVKVSADQNTGVTYLRFVLYFDTDALEYVGHTSNSLFPSSTTESIQVKAEEGYIIYLAMSRDPIAAVGDMFTVNFKTRADFCGDADIYVELVNNTAANCVTTGQKVVPFVGGSDSFKTHAIDTATGVVTDPTCTAEGYTIYHCSICDADVVGNTVAAAGHTEGEAVEENRADATCAEEGTYDSVVYCSVCGVELSREVVAIDPKGHTEGETIEENHNEPTCLGEGSYDSVVYCTVCGEELSRETIAIDALGHDIVKNAAKAPTCTEIGWDAYDTCSRCDYTTYVEIPAHGHLEYTVAEENKVDATCTKDGSYDHVVYCKTCGVELSREKKTLNALGHDLVNHESKAPTCIEIGWDAYNACKRCDYTTYVEKDALGHKEAEAVVENRVESDCTNKGYYDSVVYCSVCDAELSRETIAIDVLGHDIVKNTAKAPTCTEIGWDAYETCARCDYTTYAEKAALGHKNATAVEENRVEATCLENGSYDSVVYCSVCDVELSREEKVIVALGHGIVKNAAKAPTCNEIGWNAYDTCSRCEYTTYVEKAVLGHSYDNNCDIDCNVCDATRTVPDHIYHNACDTTCNECGIVRTVKEHSYDDCFKDYEVVIDGNWQITADKTGVYIVTLASELEGGFNVHDIAVFDKQGCKVVYNEKFGGWPLVGGLDYTVKFRYNCEAVIGDTVAWNLQSIGNTIFDDTIASEWYNDAVTYSVGRGIIGGYDNGMFGTSDSIQRQDFLVMLARLDGADLSKYANLDSAFPDVAKDSYYEAAVIWGAEKGIVDGYDDGTFGVGDKITREQLVTFLYRYAKYKGLDITCSDATKDTVSKTYADYKYVSSFAKEPVLWAIENGVIKGKTSTTIVPQGNAQRCEVAQIMYNIFLNDVF